MEKIKLVIWDLDETFWKGTLSEGEVSIVEQNVEIVKELTRRGIINSISSKNDFEKAKSELVKAGVWDYFVFPSIDWAPKGQNVKSIIEDCQLRAPNVLFIDDNIGNRKEVEHYNPNINIADEGIISQLLGMEELKGKDDSGLSRLKQYKILEQKADVKATYTDNHAFLRDSDIRISFIADVKQNKGRILELINRTNQLNFTKIRLNEEELEKVLSNDNYDNVCLHVKDRFGDYGICGFYSFNKSEKKLEHFLFSCRILNLGIPAYVYNKLHKPALSITNPVAELLDNNDIDWIIEEEVERLNNLEAKSSNLKKKRILLLGGCDLEQLCHYIDNNKFEIITEFNYPNSLGRAVHREHTQLLKAALYCTKEEKDDIGEIPFCDNKMFNTILFSDDYDVLVYSVLMNYTQDVFQHKSKKWCITYGGYSNSMETIMDSLNLSPLEREVFQKNYNYIGQQSSDDFNKDLEWLRSVVNKPIVFINGAEIPDFNQEEIGAYERHKKLNSILDGFIITHEGCKLVDMRNVVLSRADCKDNIRHYQRPIYIKMAETIMGIVGGEEMRVKTATKIKFGLLYKLKSFYRRFKKKFRH